MSNQNIKSNTSYFTRALITGSALGAIPAFIEITAPPLITWSNFRTFIEVVTAVYLNVYILGIPTRNRQYQKTKARFILSYLFSAASTYLIYKALAWLITQLLQ